VHRVIKLFLVLGEDKFQGLLSERIDPTYSVSLHDEVLEKFGKTISSGEAQNDGLIFMLAVFLVPTETSNRSRDKREAKIRVIA
jgi:hypothetical protein